MKVPLVDLRQQLRPIEEEVIAAVNEVIKSTQYVLGSEVEQFESAVAEYVPVGFAVGVSSGTDALLVALMALDVKPGDIVLTPAYSFFATAGVVFRLGAQPAFVDIDPKTYNMCPDSLSRWFATNKKDAVRVKAVIPVHLFGQCAEMGQIKDVARKYDVPIVEDAAQALGAQYPANGVLQRAGQLGRIACYSFFPTKNLGAIGDAGMVVTDDADLANKLRRLRVHGAEPKYHHDIVGGNFRLDAVQASVLRVKLRYLDEWNRMRRERARFYDSGLSGSVVRTPHVAYSRDCHIYNQYVISVPNRRDDFRTYLKENGVGSEVYYPVPLHLQPCFRALGHRPGDFPCSEHAAQHTLALPVFGEMTEEMQQYVIDKIRGFYE